MNKLYSFLVSLVAIGCSLSCVDDYTDANPPRGLDAPWIMAMPNDTVFLGESVEFEVFVSDAPGLIDSVSFTLSDTMGTFVLDEASVAAIIGSTAGSFKGTYTAPDYEDGDIEIRFTVYDRQSATDFKGKSIDQRKSTTRTKTVVFLHSTDDPEILTITPAAAAVASVGAGAEIEFSVTFDIPAGFGGIEVPIVTGGGEVSFDQGQLDDLVGETEGVVSVFYTAPTDRIGLNRITFTLFENTPAQRRSATGGRNISVTSCLISVEDAADIVGIYDAEATGNVGAADTTYTITATGIEITQPDPDVSSFEISDVSFGLYAQVYDRATAPSGEIHICDGNIFDNDVEDIFEKGFTISGVVNEDGTITIEWSNESGDSGEVTLTKQ